MEDHTDATGPPTLENLAAEQAELQATVQLMSTSLRRLVEREPADPAATAELVRWVCWLVDRYELGVTVPECWAQHGAIVEELDALRLAWLATVPTNSTGFGAVQWHDYLGHSPLTTIASGWATSRASPQGWFRSWSPSRHR